jgi:hypothetical protein
MAETRQRICSRCGETDPAAFAPWSCWCRPCHNQYLRDYRRTEKFRAWAAAYYARPDVVVRRKREAARYEATARSSARRSKGEVA